MSGTDDPESARMLDLAHELDATMVRVREAERASAAALARLAPEHRPSGVNLVRYATVRQQDLRRLQLGLWQRGLSSLGQLEAHVLDSLQQVRQRLADALIARGVPHVRPPLEAALSWDDAESRLHAHTRALLGPKPVARHVYVMVTAPSTDEVDAAWADRIVRAGTSVLRINAAHEDEAAWLRTLERVRAAASRAGSPLRVMIDLPGPKLRTVLPSAGTRVVRWRPRRDELGRVIAPVRTRVIPGERPSASADTLTIPNDVFAELATGDEISFVDTRDRVRGLRVIERASDHAIATSDVTSYVAPGTSIEIRRGDRARARFEILDVPARRFALRLAEGDTLALIAVHDETPPPRRADGVPVVGCPEPAAVDALRVGGRVLFDDGNVEARVESRAAGLAMLRVSHARGGSFALRDAKGINLPDTQLDLPPLPDADRRALAFAIEHADIIGMSFVRGPEDVRALHAALASANARPELGVVLKIETVEATSRLPAILLAAMERAPTGVMIARGDLAVEAGFERLAELQEQILWMCEAAHLPVIWATQVLDTLARDGRPSRAEVTDAAMAVRAECVMLNKGPYVVDAIRALDDILRRMEAHQYKKRSLYRRLQIAGEPH